jgi:hypothetical protein
MRYLWGIVVFACVATSCSTAVDMSPQSVAPSQADWIAAFGELPPEDQSLVQKTALVFRVSREGSDGKIYYMTGRQDTNEASKYHRLDLKKICEGYNLCFGQGSVNICDVVHATSYEQLTTPSGVAKINFKLNWQFHCGNGSDIVISSVGSGPGVKLFWGGSNKAIQDDTNRAFALTFLRLVVRLASYDRKMAL